jgi:hypothetical protein
MKEQKIMHNLKQFYTFVWIPLLFLLMLCSCSEDESQPETVYSRSQLLSFKINGLESAILSKKASISSKRDEIWKLAQNKKKTILPNGKEGDMGVIKGKDVNTL